MKITTDALGFISRRASELESPVFLIFYSKTHGWWGIVYDVQLKIEENPFTGKKLAHGKSEFIEIDIKDCPCPAFIDKEMDDLVLNSRVEMEKIGMFKKLRLMG